MVRSEVRYIEVKCVMDTNQGPIQVLVLQYTLTDTPYQTSLVDVTTQAEDSGRKL